MNVAYQRLSPEEAAIIAKHSGLEDHNVGQLSLNDFHSCSPASLSKYCP